MSDFGPRPRRIVTGHDARGVSIIESDGEIPVYRVMPKFGAAFYEVWQTEGAPAPISAAEPDDPTQRELRVPPPPQGTKIRINEFLPGHLDERGAQSPFHRTETIDYGIVLKGEIVLMLDEEEVVVRPGDVVIQRGTDHAWANRTDSVALMAFVLVDARYDDALRAALPADAELMDDGINNAPGGAIGGGH